MKNLYIIGAGGLGRELVGWLELHHDHNRYWSIKGFLDDNCNALEGYTSEYRILGTPAEYSFCENDICVMAIADVHVKERMFNSLKKRTEFLTFISDRSTIGKCNSIGEGSVICPNAVITTNVKIGACTFVNCGTQIGHDSVIQDFVSFMANIDVGGGCYIGRQTFVGSGATLIPKRKIGENVKIGAGSVVLNNIKDGFCVFGNPARKIVL